MVFILEKRPESTQGATLRYIGILGRDNIETLKFDPQIDGIKIRVWLLIVVAEFGRCCLLFLMHEIGRSIQASLSLPKRSQNTVQVHVIKWLVLYKTLLILMMWMFSPLPLLIPIKSNTFQFNPTNQELYWVYLSYCPIRSYKKLLILSIIWGYVWG